MPKKKPLEGKPVVHPELDGFEMSINEFGEITSNTKVDVLNDFLNKHVDDKKFRDLDSIPVKNAKRKDDEDDDDDEMDDEDDDEMDDDEIEDEDDLDSDEKDPYDIDDKEHDYEDIEDLVKNMEKDFGKKGRGANDDEEADEEENDDFSEEEFLDEYNDDFSEEDNYNFGDGEKDDY